jgi:tRNA (guanine-N7-)-methyltransferase
LHANSRPVTSNQKYLHTGLGPLVVKHLASRYRKPVVSHNLAAFETLKQTLQSVPRPLVLDSFCGTGHSTRLLAQRHSQHLVVGIDKSAARLGKEASPSTDNCLLLQADCEDIWQLLLLEGLTVDYHYLLYPNPWPKAKHLQRRIHGHGSFPWLLQLGGLLELRSNWRVYVEEFGVAMHLAGYPGRVSMVAEESSITRFEQKYRASGHDLWTFTGAVTKSAL